MFEARDLVFELSMIHCRILYRQFTIPCGERLSRRLPPLRISSRLGNRLILVLALILKLPLAKSLALLPSGSTSNSTLACTPAATPEPPLIWFSQYLYLIEMKYFHAAIDDWDSTLLNLECRGRARRSWIGQPRENHVGNSRLK